MKKYISLLNKQGKSGVKNILALHRYRDFRVGTCYFASPCRELHAAAAMHSDLED